MKKLSCFLLLVCLRIQISLVLAQNVSITSGHVSDEKGSAIEGDAVMEIGPPGNATYF